MKVKPWLLAVLVFCLVFSMLGGTAFGASARYAIVTEVVGDVTVAKAGGALEIPVSVGMRLHEGDRLSVGKGGFLTLKTSDREDEIAIGENWRGTLSKLRENDSGGTDTALKTWAGSMYSNVRKKTGTNDTYKVETPTAVMDARGTHFTVVVDRFTGLVKIVVNAGVVQTGSDSPDDSKVPVMPSQQATVYPWMNNWADLEYIDPEDITVSVSAEVIAKLLKNKALIDEENEELLNRLAEYDEETDLNLQEEEVLAKYKSNVEHMLSHILKAAAQAGKLDSVTVEDIIETVNRSIAETNKQFDLERDVPPIDRSAGIDPEKEEQRRQMREQAERSKQEKQQQIDENRKNVLDRNQELKDRIEKQKEEQELENRLAEEKKITEASEQRRKQLEEDRQKALDERRQERETKDRSQEETDSSPGSPDDPIATSTSIQLSDSSIVYGQSFTFTAEVKTSASGAVPDGGIVAFKIGESFIGFATIADGKATLTVDKEKWASPELSGVPVGVHNVSAVYAGVAQQYGSSTSPAQALTIAKADTIVELAVNPDPPKPGDILDIRVNVAVKEPGGGEPTGMITLYRLLNDEWQPADEPIRLEPGMQSVSFQDTFLKDTGASEMQYKAEFVSDKGRHNNGMSEVKEIVVQPPDPVDLPPIVHVKKAAGDESHVFEIVVDLANFTVEKAVYGAELHFRHPKGMEPIPAFQYTPYNSEKFDSNHLLDKDFIITWRETEGNAALITIFDLRLNDPDHAVEFSGMENMAKIRFELYDTTEETAEEIDDITVELVYCRFTGRNGEPIDVSVQPGEGIILNLSE
jgi:hypothetical protein